MQRWKKGLVLLIAVVIAGTAVVATQYAKVGISYAKVKIDARYSAIQFMAGDGSPTTTGYVINGSVNDDAYQLDFGTWIENATKTFTAAFAIVNTENVDLRIIGVDITGTIPTTGYKIYLHGNMSKLSNSVAGVPEEIMNTDNEDCEVNDGSLTYFNATAGAVDHTSSGWVLNGGTPYSGGNLRYANGGVTETAAWDATNYVWVYDTTPTGGNDATALRCGTNGAASNANYVWAEISITIPATSSAPQIYSGTILFKFKAI